eukprot:1337721-Amphidinium_carterae.4
MSSIFELDTRKVCGHGLCLPEAYHGCDLKKSDKIEPCDHQANWSNIYKQVLLKRAQNGAEKETWELGTKLFATCLQ